MRPLGGPEAATFRVVGGTECSPAAFLTLVASERTGGPDNRHPESEERLFVACGSGSAIGAATRERTSWPAAQDGGGAVDSRSTSVVASRVIVPGRPGCPMREKSRSAARTPISRAGWAITVSDGVIN